MEYEGETMEPEDGLSGYSTSEVDWGEDQTEHGEQANYDRGSWYQDYLDHESGKEHEPLDYEQDITNSRSWYEEDEGDHESYLGEDRGDESWREEADSQLSVDEGYHEDELEHEELNQREEPNQFMEPYHKDKSWCEETDSQISLEETNPSNEDPWNKEAEPEANLDDKPWFEEEELEHG